MANAWVEFVRKWAKDNGETYSCAVSLPACREAYQATKPPKKAKRLTQKQEREAMGAEDVASTAQRAEATASLQKKKASINRGKTILKAKLAKKDVEKELVEKFPAYAENKSMRMEDVNVAEKKADVVDVRPRGRPKKYATAEEAKLAKATKTVEAKKKRQATKKAEKAQKKAERPNIQFQILDEAVPSTEPVAKAIAPIRRRIPEPEPSPAPAPKKSTDFKEYIKSFKVGDKVLLFYEEEVRDGEVKTLTLIPSIIKKKTPAVITIQYDSSTEFIFSKPDRRNYYYYNDKFDGETDTFDKRKFDLGYRLIKKGEMGGKLDSAFTAVAGIYTGYVEFFYPIDDVEPISRYLTADREAMLKALENLSRQNQSQLVSQNINLINGDLQKQERNMEKYGLTYESSTGRGIGGKSPCVNGKELKKGRCVRIPKTGGVKRNYIGEPITGSPLSLQETILRQSTTPQLERMLEEIARKGFDLTPLVEAINKELENRELPEEYDMWNNLLLGRDEDGNPLTGRGAIEISNPEINHDWFHNYAQRLNQPLINYKGLADSIAHPNIAQVRDLVGKINGLIG